MGDQGETPGLARRILSSKLRTPILFVALLLALYFASYAIILPLFTSSSSPAAAEISGTLPVRARAGEAMQLELDYNNEGVSGIDPICMSVRDGNGLRISHVVINNIDPAQARGGTVCGGYLGASEVVSIDATIVFPVAGHDTLVLTPLEGTTTDGPVRRVNVVVTAS